MIPLTQSQVTLVDAADYEDVAAHKWFACKIQREKFVAVRNRPRADGGGLIYMARYLLGLEHGDPRESDHINHDTLDNRRVNLRVVTAAENKRWQPSRGGSSQYVGVTWDASRSKWRAQIQVDGRVINLGRYDDEADAADARDAYVLMHVTGHTLNRARG